MRALLVLVLYDVTSFFFGFLRVYRLAGCGYCQPIGLRHCSPTDIFDAVNLASCLYYKPVRCLQRSVVSVRLLRKYGIKCRLVISYRPSPFLMHAWVELNGKISNDLSGYAEQLLVLKKV